MQLSLSEELLIYTEITYRYCGNNKKHFKILHDLNNERNTCQVDKIIAAGNSVFFETIEAAIEKKYFLCSHCFPQQGHKQKG